MLPTTYHCKINSCTIQTVKSAKYLSLTISYDLSWSDHIPINTGKANSVLAFFQRNLYHCSQDLKAKKYVHSIVEYASVIWSPCTQSRIHEVEMESGHKLVHTFLCSAPYSTHGQNKFIH